MVERKNKKAFTLIEILIAMSIFFTLSYLAYSSVDGAFVLSAEVKEDEDFNLSMIRVVSRIKRELSNTFMLVYRGENARVKTIFKSQNDDIDKITFTSFSKLRTNFNAKESDQAEISYFGRRNDNNSYNLMRRESYFIDDKPEKGGVIRTIAKNIKEFHCKYYKTESKEWVDEWNTDGVETGRRLPPYMKCKIVFLRNISPEETKEESIFFSVKIILKEAIK